MNEYYKARRQFLEVHQVELDEWAPPVSVVFIVFFIFLLAMINYRVQGMNDNFVASQDNLTTTIQHMAPVVERLNDDGWDTEEDEANPFIMVEHAVTMDQAPMTSKMSEVYGMNHDTIGWLQIDGMIIDYPVMQTPWDEQYYLNRDFDGNYSAYGCLLADTDSSIGSGTRANNYADGTRPSTNLIIHGHNMKDGSMFGNLDKYRDESYGKEHKIIRFSSLYEDREYEVCAVFLSQVYRKTDDVFKYYKFFQANTESEFNDFYRNIKDLSLYDTGVEASYGDEFITLSVCAYHVENGRLVVVGKRTR